MIISEFEKHHREICNAWDLPCCCRIIWDAAFASQSDELESLRKKFAGTMETINTLSNNQNEYSFEVHDLKRQLAEAHEYHDAYLQSFKEDYAKLAQINAECRDAALVAFKKIQTGLGMIICDEDLTDEKMREYSESTLPHLCDVATHAIHRLLQAKAGKEKP